MNWRDQLYHDGVRIPIIPGLICAQSFSQIQRFAKMCGCMVPSQLIKNLERFAGNAEDSLRVGLDHAEKQLEGLIREGIRGVHLYALNRSEVVNDLAPMMVGSKNRTDLKSSLENHARLGF